MHDSLWKYEYEVEHERLLKCKAEIEELKEECQGELKGMEIAFDIKQEAINKLKEGYLRVRDALILGDIEEAYHTLYKMADPEFKSNHPWKEWEALKDGK